MDLVEAQTHASDHRAEIEGSTLCGCFHCLAVYPAGSITRWVDGGQTAVCPRCGIDAVLGDRIGVAMKRPFLENMQRRWFASRAAQKH